jgi:anti-anti-sigma regulatory factor
VRIARSVPTLDPVDVGDHVCWLVGPGEDYVGMAGAFVADGALFGDKVLVVGSHDDRWPRLGPADDLVVVDPGAEHVGGGWDADAMLGVVRREADTACRQGFRALRVLAQMEYVWPAGARPDQVAGHELSLEALTADGGMIVVCAYQRDRFGPTALEQAAGVHPQHVGGRGFVTPGFRMFSAGTDCWSVIGVVDAEGAAAFHAAVGQLALRSATVRLRCEGLELMDAAGMEALAMVARERPGRRVLVQGANETVRRCWSLLGYDVPEVPVEMAP